MTTVLHFWWQVLVAAIAYFALGAIWFNPKVFGTIWAKSHGIVMDPAKRAETNMGRLFAMSFLCALILSSAVCWVCCASCQGGSCSAPGGMGIIHCIKSGLIVGGSGFAAISMGYIYQMKPLNAFLTDGGYNLTGSVLAGIIYYYLGCC
jgi:hypothetical protein